MPPTHCNIDARGKMVRAVWGGLCLLAAIAITAGMLLDALTGWQWWIAVAVTAVFGLLGLYEARKGWCFVRAMGFKTPV